VPCVGKTRSSEGLIRFPNVAPTSFSAPVRASSLQRVPWGQGLVRPVFVRPACGTYRPRNKCLVRLAGRIGRLHARAIPPSFDQLQPLGSFVQSPFGLAFEADGETSS
jgi:hypothetical protein